MFSRRALSDHLVADNQAVHILEPLRILEAANIQGRIVSRRHELGDHVARQQLLVADDGVHAVTSVAELFQDLQQQITIDNNNNVSTEQQQK